MLITLKAKSCYKQNMNKKPKLIIKFSDKQTTKEKQRRILAEYIPTLMRWNIEAKKKKS